MHIAVCWAISAPTPDREQVIDTYLRGAFASFSYVQPIANFFIVKISNPEDRTKINLQLQALSKGVSERVEFVVTPIMPTGARYAGMLIPTTWPKVNDNTD
jgi:hypothetical protein